MNQSLIRNWILAGLLSFTTISFAAPVTLITDNFDTGTVTADLNTSLGSRQGGTLATIPYLKNATFPFINLSNLTMTAGARVWLDHDFTDAVIGTEGGFRVSFDMQVTGGTSGEWMGIAVGSPSTGSGIAEASSDFNVLFRNTTTGHRFTGSTSHGDFTYRSAASTNDFFHVDLWVLTGGFSTGAPATANLLVNGSLVMSQAFNWDAQGANYIVFNASGAPGPIDNFSITAIPEPASGVLAAFAAALLWQRRPRQNG